MLCCTEVGVIDDRQGGLGWQVNRVDLVKYIRQEEGRRYVKGTWFLH